MIRSTSYEKKWVRLNYATTHHQPKYIHYYLPIPKKWTTTPQKPKYIQI